MFEGDSSIVLLGVRGSGKTTLAIIAQVSLGLQHVDADEFFRRETGESPANFRKQFGPQESRMRWLAVLEKLLRKRSKKCAIVWPKDYVEDAALSLLKQFAKTHPVILVQRDGAAIEKYLQLSESTTMERIMKLLVPAYRSCSNYEYFNLDERESLVFNGNTRDDISTAPFAADHQKPRSLLLKRVEESFLLLIKNIMAQDSDMDQDHDRSVLPQSRATYTYMLTLPVPQVVSEDFKNEWLNCGADAVQLEIPLGIEGTPSLTKDQISRALATITRSFDGPIIYHLRPASAELSGISTSLYLDLLDYGFRLGVDFVTVQLGLPIEEVEGLIKLSTTSRLIGIYHDSTPGENGWASPPRHTMLEKAMSLGFDAVRFTQPAISSSDNGEAMSFAVSANRRNLSRRRVSAYNTGPLGRTSRCFNEILTPVTTEELRNHSSNFVRERSLESEITIRQSQGSLYASFVYDPMNYYIIGLDVSYSYSPIIHTTAHQFFGMPHRLHIRSISTLDEISHLTSDENFGGLTVAQGFKTTLLSRMSALSPHAESIGAMNTLVPIRTAFDYSKPPPRDFWTKRNRAGPVLGFYGDNVDWVGISRCIKQNLSPANVISPSSTALVIGAGGMARAAIYALLNLGVHHIVLNNRTAMRAHTLAQHFSEVSLDGPINYGFVTIPQNESIVTPPSRRDIRVLDTLQTDWYDDLALPTMVLSCIPVPKALSVDHSPLPPHLMGSSTGGVVIEMSYRSLITPLLRQAWTMAHQGWIAVDGLENLVQQASAQFEVFTCRKVPKNLMCIAALQHCLNSNKEDPETRQYIEGKLRRIQSQA